MHTNLHRRIGAVARSRRSQGVVVGVVLGTVLTGGFASAATSTTMASGSAGAVNACRDKVTGLLRVPDAKQTACRTWEAALTWGITGPAGVAGPQGPAGPAGPGGLTCADERRIAAAVPGFSLSAACAPGSPGSGGDPAPQVLMGLNTGSGTVVVGGQLTAQVFLSAPLDHDLTVQITADDSTALTVSDAFIPAGTTSGIFEMTGLTAGAHVTLTATAGGMLPAVGFVDVTAPPAG